MPCCGGSSCTCKVAAGTGVTVTGSGTGADPIVVSVTPMTVLDNTTFDLTLAGNVLSLAYATTAKLDHLPDVNAPTPTNGQVLSYNTSSQTWVPANPTTASSGSVQHDTSLSGDGSAGTPLQILEDPNGMLGTKAAGLGLTDVAVNQLVRGFTDSAARGTASPFPDKNTLSMLDVESGLLDYFDGTSWVPVPGTNKVDMTGQLLTLSGVYNSTLRSTQMVRQVTASTDASGVFEILGTTALSGYAGVLTCQFQETGAIAFKTMVVPDTTNGVINGVAYRVSDGTPLALQNVTGTVLAWLY